MSLDRFAIGFLAGVATAALLLTIALLREMSQTAIPVPYDPTDEAGA